MSLWTSKTTTVAACRTGSPGTSTSVLRSPATTLLNLEAGYKYKNILAQLDVFNLLNSKRHEIDYFYVSRLPGAPAAGVADVHFHPVEPRTVRFSLAYKF